MAGMNYQQHTQLSNQHTCHFAYSLCPAGEKSSSNTFSFSLGCIYQSPSAFPVHPAAYVGKRVVDDANLESAYPGLFQSTKGIQFVWQIPVLSYLIITW
jgi:hypothetical protein